MSAYDSGIYDAFAALVAGYANTKGDLLTVAWPGVTFKPPDTGEWLEVLWFPNETQNIALGSDGSQHRGFGQVSCCSRPGAGIEPVMLRAEAIIALFAKGTALGVARVDRKPWMSTILNAGDRVSAPVTVPYATGAVAN